MMNKTFLLSCLLLTLCLNAIAADPAVFRFSYSEQFLFDRINDDNTFRKSDKSPSVVNFNNYLYVAYRGFDKLVNVAMIGRVDYADFEDTLRATNKETILPKPTTNVPALLVVNNKLVLMYIEDGTSLLHYYVVDSAGGLNFRTSEPIDLSLSIEDLPAGGSFAGIAAANVSGGNFLGALLYKAPQSASNKLVAVNLRLSSNDRLFIEEQFQLPYATDYMPSLCSLSMDFVGFAITRLSDKHPLFFTYKVDDATVDAEYTFTQAVSEEAPVLYRRPGDNVLHLLWASLDNTISQASFTIDFSKIQISKLTNDDNKMKSKFAPAIFPFNNLFSGIIWIGADKNEFLLGRALAYNYNSWMGDLLNDELLFKEISLPGSDNAVMTPDDFRNKFISRATEFLDKEINQCSECNSVFQALSLEEQLDVGVRYLQTNLMSTDFKTIFGEKTTSGYVENVNFIQDVPLPGRCFGGTDFKDILEIIQEFLEKNEEEFVILNIEEIEDRLLISTLAEVKKTLDTFIEEDELKFFKPREPFFNSYNDLLDVPLKELRGKLIITTNYTELLDRFPFFQNPFNGTGSYNVKKERLPIELEDMIEDQREFLVGESDYRRIDWYLNTTRLRAACNFGLLRDCIELVEDFENLREKAKHIFTHTFGCGLQVYELIHSFAESPAKAAVIVIVGITVDIAELTGNVSKIYEEANAKIPRIFNKWQKDGTLRPENRYNILLTSFSSDWISDVVIRDNVYFNSPKLVSPYNKLTDVQVDVRNEFCDQGLKSDLEVSATGQYGPFSFSWLHNNSADALQEAMEEGFYEVEVKDGWGNTVVERVHLQPNFRQFSGLSNVSTAVTRHHPKRSHLSYSKDCDGLIAGIRSSTDFGSWHGQTTVRSVFDAIPTRNYVARHFDIQAVNHGPAEITLFFTQDDFNRYNAASPEFLLPKNPGDPNTANMVIFQQKGRSDSGMWGTYSGETEKMVLETEQIQWDAANQRWSVSVRARTEGGFFLSTADGQVVNQFLTAKAFGIGPNNTIQWKARERDVYAYFVEYSFDGDLFFNLSRVAAKGFGQQVYEVRHSDVLLPPGQQVIYYRVRQVSKNYTSLFSEVLPVNMSNVNPLLVHPNPASQYLNITSQRDCKIQVTDMTGRKMLEADVVVGRNEFNILSWSKGLYILSTNDGESQKIMVQ